MLTRAVEAAKACGVSDVVVARVAGSVKGSLVALLIPVLGSRVLAKQFRSVFQKAG